MLHEIPFWRQMVGPASRAAFRKQGECKGQGFDRGITPASAMHWFIPLQNLNEYFAMEEMSDWRRRSIGTQTHQNPAVNCGPKVSSPQNRSRLFLRFHKGTL